MITKALFAFEWGPTMPSCPSLVSFKRVEKGASALVSYDTGLGGCLDSGHVSVISIEHGMRLKGKVKLIRYQADLGGRSWRLI